MSSVLGGRHLAVVVTAILALFALRASGARAAPGDSFLEFAKLTAPSTGAVYVFTRSGAAWTLEAELTPPTSGAARAIGTDTEFGGQVALPTSSATSPLRAHRQISPPGPPTAASR